MGDGPVGDGGIARRTLLRRVGVGAAVAWTAPVVWSAPARAQGTAAAPDFVVGSAAWGVNTSAGTTITITKPGSVQAGDLLLAVMAGDDNDTLFTPSGFTLLENATVNPSGTFNSIQARLFQRTVQAGDTFYTFTRDCGLCFTPGIFRAAIVAYRSAAGSTQVVTSAVQGNFDGVSPGTSQGWPAVGSEPEMQRVVRLGANSRYAGLGTQSWIPPNPASDVRIQTTLGGGADNGSRGIHVSDEVDSYGSATGTVDRNVGSVTFTAALEAVP